ncbi:hypothetical protein MNV49_006983 [Pseudohyphozyma bogoriensis]|nr:hypothetical protein MNV49_006983 [Pseudohyphozyma bogoriensis]
MLVQLSKDPSSGLLGGEIKLGTDRYTGNMLETQLFFRSAEDVQTFAKTKLHMEMRKYYNGLKPEEAKEIELYHELFTVKAGQIDAIYLNSPPHGFGRLYEEDKESGEWVSALRKVEEGGEYEREEDGR